jgi:hypothetical protein
LTDKAHHKEMSLIEWDNWYRQTLEQRIEDIDTLLYLTDIELHGGDFTSSLLKLNPFLNDADSLADRGPRSLNWYIWRTSHDIKIPNMGYRLYVAPVIHDIAILTPPHRDGFGTQTSMHVQLFGDGYNLVYIWDLTPGQKEIFQRIVGLLPLPDKQHLPHAEPYEFNAADTDAWDTMREERLREWGIMGKAIKLL